MSHSPRLNLRFAFGFAWKDLADRRAAAPTLVIVFTIALTTALSALAFTLPQAAEEARRKEMGQKPLATCLWGRHVTQELLEPDLQEEQVRALHTRLESGLDSRDDLVGCYPVRVLDLEWRFPNNEKEQRTQLRGRTLAPGDPLFRSCRTKYGKTLSEGEPGIIAAPKMLELLGYPADLPPGSMLTVIRPGGSHAPMPVQLVDVFVDRLPDGYLYLMTEAYHIQILNTDDDVQMQAVVSGPVHPDWPDPLALPATLLDRLEEKEGLRITLIIQDAGKPRAWQIESIRARPPDFATWRDKLLPLIHRLLRDVAKLVAADQFEKLRPPPQTRPVVRPDGYQRVAIYVRDVKDLRPAAEIARQNEIRVNENIVDQLSAYSEAVQTAQKLRDFALPALWLLATINLTALQSLLAQRKAPEIGMLRAIGMSNRTLLSLYLLEAFILWGLGSLYGLFLTMYVGALLSARVLPEGDWSALLTLKWFCHLGLFLLGSLFFGLVSNFVITYSTCRTSPALSLNR